MGELHTFSSKTSGGALARLAAELQRSIEQGDDLGARDQRVRAAAVNLIDFARQLRASCDDLTGILTRLGEKPDDMLDGLRRLADMAEDLARTATHFPAQHLA